MKCTNYVGKVHVPAKGRKPEHYRYVSMRPDWVEQTSKYNQFIEPPKPCTGTLSVHIDVSQGCCCGHESSELCLTFFCTECGTIEFEGAGLPNKYDFSEWLNALMGRVDEMEYEDQTTRNNRLQAIRNVKVQALIDTGMKPEAALRKVMDADMKEAIAKQREVMNETRKRKTLTRP